MLEGRWNREQVEQVFRPTVEGIIGQLQERVRKEGEYKVR